MNEMSLSRLYRRLTSQREHPVANVDDLVDIAAPSAGVDTIDAERRARVAARLAESSAEVDLARMLRAMHPVSESLARDVRDSRRAAVHPPRGREQRIALGTRRSRHVRGLRWVGGIAACLSIALGLWSWHHADEAPQASVAAAVRSAASSDRIFVSSDTIFSSSSDVGPQTQSLGRRGDELFRGHFSG